MKRLDEIPKKTLFEVPDGYFEKLPGRIQERVSTPERSLRSLEGWGKLTLRYALPVTILGAVALFVLNNRPDLSPEQVIASIDSDQLVAYLQDSELNTDDLLESVNLDADEVMNLELDALGDMMLDETVIDEFGPSDKLDSVQ